MGTYLESTTRGEVSLLTDVSAKSCRCRHCLRL